MRGFHESFHLYFVKEDNLLFLSSRIKACPASFYVERL